MHHFPGSSINEIAEKSWKNGQKWMHHFPGSLYIGKSSGQETPGKLEEWLKWACWHSCCQRYMSVAPWLRHVFFRVHCRACFCLVLFLHHHSLCLFFSITKVPKVILLVRGCMLPKTWDDGLQICVFLFLLMCMSLTLCMYLYVCKCMFMQCMQVHVLHYCQERWTHKRAIHKCTAHACACISHTHTHTQCTHDIHMHVCVDCI